MHHHNLLLDNVISLDNPECTLNVHAPFLPCMDTIFTIFRSFHATETHCFPAHRRMHPCHPMTTRIHSTSLSFMSLLYLEVLMVGQNNPHQHPHNLVQLLILYHYDPPIHLYPLLPNRPISFEARETSPSLSPSHGKAHTPIEVAPLPKPLIALQTYKKCSRCHKIGHDHKDFLTLP